MSALWRSGLARIVRRGMRIPLLSLHLLMGLVIAAALGRAASAATAPPRRWSGGVGGYAGF
ncbi:MAG: hypothetical protein IPK63_17715 [Candidatus Competibacteraceae bacterium]|nr:hypothetical protein [Candidatus Competibacteraceae bacterium]